MNQQPTAPPSRRRDKNVLLKTLSLLLLLSLSGTAFGQRANKYDNMGTLKYGYSVSVAKRTYQVQGDSCIVADNSVYCKTDDPKDLFIGETAMFIMGTKECDPRAATRDPSTCTIDSIPDITYCATRAPTSYTDALRYPCYASSTEPTNVLALLGRNEAKKLGDGFNLESDAGPFSGSEYGVAILVPYRLYTAKDRSKWIAVPVPKGGEVFYNIAMK